MIALPARRRPVLSVIGNAGNIPDAHRLAAFELGRLAVDRGFRIVCGGMNGVMEAVAQGAHASQRYREGDTMGIGQSYDPAALNPWIDIVIPTGMGLSRNMIVVSSGDIVVALGGGSGTLSEIALAWQIGRKVLAYTGSGGWADRVAGMRLDVRQEDPIEGFEDLQALIDRAWELTGPNLHHGLAQAVSP